jgi:hypothetical protein
VELFAIQLWEFNFHPYEGIIKSFLWHMGQGRLRIRKMTNHMGYMWIKDSFVELVFRDQQHQMRKMPHMSRDHESWVASDGNHAMVLNPSEMIFTIAPMTKVNVRV